MKTSLLWILLTVYLLDVNEVTARANCPKPTLKYGRAKVRSKGRIVRYRCRKKFQLYGAKMAVCLSGKWSHPTPVCIVARCKDVVPNADVIINKEMGGALLKFSCKSGLTLKGASEIYCHNRKWNDVVPTCFYRKPEKTCDFEKDDLCGWTQDKSDTPNFDWIQNSGDTPTDKTGPDQDHTFPDTSDGHYMYIEASSPRRKGHFARFLSPFYKPIADGYCFDFWYHMMGPSGRGRVGSLDIFVRGSNQTFDDVLVPEFSKSENQGDSWQRGKFELGEQTDMFQIVIVGTRGSSYLSDISIDDVRIYNCSDDDEVQTTAVEITTAEISTPFVSSTTVNDMPTSVQNYPDETSSILEPSTVQTKQHLTTQSVISTQLITVKSNDFNNDSKATFVPEPTSSADNGQTPTNVFVELSTAETTKLSSSRGLTKEPSVTTTKMSTRDQLEDVITEESNYMTTIPTTNSSKPFTNLSTMGSKSLTTLATTDSSELLTTLSTTDNSELLTTLSTTDGSILLTTMSSANGSKPLTTLLTTNETTRAPLTTLFSKTTSTLYTTNLAKQNVSTEDMLSKFTTTMRQPKTASSKGPITLHTTNIATTEPPTSKTSAISSTTVTQTTVHTTKQQPTTTIQKSTTKRIPTTKLNNPTDGPATTSQTSSKATEVSSSSTNRKPTSLPTSVYSTKSTHESSSQRSSTSVTKHSSIMTTSKTNSTTFSSTKSTTFSSTKSTTFSSTKSENEINEIPDGKSQNNNITKSDSNINNISTTELPNVIRIGRQKNDSNVLVQPLIIGLGIGVAIGLIIVLAGIFFWIRRKRRKEAEFEDEMTPITKSSSHEW